MGDALEQALSIGDLATWVTAISTIGLVFATLALAYLTWLLAKATNRPYVVATIEPNVWTLNHLDLHIVNEGNATAFDVSLSFVPSLPQENGGRGGGHPKDISVLRSGQHLTVYAGPAERLFNETFHVTIGWSRTPGGQREGSTYPLNLTFLKSVHTLGEAPRVQLAGDVRKMREHLGRIVSGGHHLKVDVFDKGDREAEKVRRDSIRQQAMKERVQSTTVPVGAKSNEADGRSP